MSDSLAYWEAIEAKDAAYRERNQVVAALARTAMMLGWRVGLAKTTDDTWDPDSPDWHNCVFIDLPTGQASWHYHDSEAHLFEGLPAYDAPWDGHSPEEKGERLASLSRKGARARAGG